MNEETPKDSTDPEWIPKLDDKIAALNSSRVYKKVTPLHDNTWYVKWVGTIFMVLAVSSRSIGPPVDHIYDQCFSLVGLSCWFWVAFQWHDRALMTVNAICLPLLIAGIIRSLLV